MLPPEWKDRFLQLTAHTNLLVVTPDTFVKLLTYVPDGLVLHTRSLFLKRELYLTSYKGISFATRSKEVLELPAGIEVLEVGRIAIPKVEHEKSI